MTNKKRLPYTAGLLVMLSALAAIVLYNHFNPAKPPPSEKGYYTGPMRSKGNPEIFATEDGKIVPPPAGAMIPVTSAVTNSALQGAQGSGRFALD